MSAAPSDGAFAARAWLRDRDPGAPTTNRWHVEIALDVVAATAEYDFDETTATRFHLDIYREEWGVVIFHEGRSSRIIVSDAVRVLGRDDFKLLSVMPRLPDIGGLVRRLETAYTLRFQRAFAEIRTNLLGIEPAVRAWVVAL